MSAYRIGKQFSPACPPPVAVAVPTYLPSNAVVAGVGVCAAAGTASVLRITKMLRKPRDLIVVSLYRACQCGAGHVSMRPIFDPKSRHPLKLANIVGDEHQALAARVSRDQHIVGSTEQPNPGQLGTYLPEMRRGFH
jgi:hypothetical protein